MKRGWIFILLCFSFSFIYAQEKTVTSFNSNTGKGLDVCAASGNFLSETQVVDLISDMLSKVSVRNRYIIKNCTQVENCQATIYKGKPYILYNPNFLGSVKKLNFSSTTIPIANKDWETITILAHELGHHINNHLSNPLPDATQPEMELEADETAGFIVALMGGSLEQTQLAYNLLPERGDYEHPGRQKRLDAITKGWKNGAEKNVKPTNPSNKVNTVTDVDGHDYKTVKIGDQTWMAENLNVSHFKNGDIIPFIESNEEWEKYGKKGKPAWCYYDHDPVNGKKYGKLYNWFAVIDPRGLMPSGYHVPSDEDWEKMIDTIGGKKISGTKLKSKTGWADKRNKSGTGNGTDTNGFAGLPGGYRNTDGAFMWLGEEAFWWSTTMVNTSKALNCSLGYSVDIVGTDANYKQCGFSVRCIKD